MLNNRQQSKFTIDDLFSPLFFFTREMFSILSKLFISTAIKNRKINKFFHFLTSKASPPLSNLSSITPLSPPTLTLSTHNIQFLSIFSFSNQQKSSSSQSKHNINQVCHSFCQIASLPQGSYYKYL